jgi:hypothetical protein
MTTDHASHLFAGTDDRCVFCDARRGGFAARYACDNAPTEDDDRPSDYPSAESSWGRSAAGPLTEGPGD